MTCSYSFIPNSITTLDFAYQMNSTLFDSSQLACCSSFGGSFRKCFDLESFLKRLALIGCGAGLTALFADAIALSSLLENLLFADLENQLNSCRRLSKSCTRLIFFLHYHCFKSSCSREHQSFQRSEFCPKQSPQRNLTSNVFLYLHLHN
jgi:hypothetical protein